MKKFMNNLTSLWGLFPKELTRFVRYNFASVVATVADVGLYWILVSFLGIFYLIAGTFTYCIGIVINFTITRFWAFSETQEKVGKSFVAFVIVNILMLILAMGCLALFVEILGIDFLISRILVIFVVVPFNYALNYFVIFKQQNVNKKL